MRLIADMQLIPMPTGTPEDEYAHVDAALAVIESSRLEHTVTDMGTRLEGTADQVWTVMRRAFEAGLHSGAEKEFMFLKLFSCDAAPVAKPAPALAPAPSAPASRTAPPPPPPPSSGASAALSPPAAPPKPAAASQAPKLCGGGPSKAAPSSSKSAAPSPKAAVKPAPKPKPKPPPAPAPPAPPKAPAPASGQSRKRPRGQAGEEEEAAAADGGLLKRPPGRAPSGKVWDRKVGWVANGEEEEEEPTTKSSSPYKQLQAEKFPTGMQVTTKKGKEKGHVVGHKRAWINVQMLDGGQVSSFRGQDLATMAED